MFKFVLCTAVFWAAVPFLIPLLSWLYLYRALVILLQKILYPNWIGIMSPRDVIVSEDVTKPRLHCVLCNILILRREGGGEFQLETFQTEFMDKVLNFQNERGQFSYAKFQHYFEQWMGFPFWRKEERFDIQQHIRVVTPAENKTRTTKVTDEKLQQIIGDVMTLPFQSKTSPWEILIVPKYQPKKSKNSAPNRPNVNANDEKLFAAIFRYHHTLLDGFSYFTLLTERMCGEKLNAKGGKGTSCQQSQPTTVLRKMFRSMWLFMESLLNLGMIHANFFFLDRDSNIWLEKGQTGKKLTGKVHTAKCDGVPFSITRSVSKKLGVAPTATMFSCVAGGIRRYFEMKELEIPQQMTAFFPWPVENHPNEGLVNHWSFVDIALPVGERDCVERISKTNVHFQTLKNSTLAKVIWNLSPFFAAVPSPLFDLWGWNRKSTLVMSNFAGPNVVGDSSPLILFDKWTLLENVGYLTRQRGDSPVQLTMYTDNGNINVAISVDRGILTEQDSKQLTRCINEEFKSLQFLF